jgi:hypothetical protein
MLIRVIKTLEGSLAMFVVVKTVVVQWEALI